MPLYRIPLFLGLIIVMTLGTGNKAQGQLGDIGELFEGGQEDAQLLLQEYLKPFGSGFGAGINSGWVDRANTHGTLGFHLKLNVTAAIVPSADKDFNVNDLGLSKLEVLHGDNPVTPTFSGTSESGPMLGFRERIEQTGEMVDIEAFRMPEGIGLDFIPTPMIQAGVGLPKNTDLMLRYVPALNYEDYGEVSLLGVGVKHEINQWLPAGRILPVTLSVMAGYTTFRSHVDLDAQPTPQDYDHDPKNLDTPGQWDDQQISLNSDAFTMNILVGKSLPILSVYGGIGFETSTTSVNVDGNYPYYEPVNVQPEGSYDMELNALTDPIDISLDGANTLRALAGVRISLPLITFNVDYTYADYSMVSAGLGISLR